MMGRLITSIRAAALGALASVAFAGASSVPGGALAQTSASDTLWTEVSLALAAPTNIKIEAAAAKLVALGESDRSTYDSIEGRAMLIALAEAQEVRGDVSGALDILNEVYKLDRLAQPKRTSLNDDLELIDDMARLLAEEGSYVNALDFKLRGYLIDRANRRGKDDDTAALSAAQHGKAYLDFEKEILRKNLSADVRRAVSIWISQNINEKLRRELALEAPAEAPETARLAKKRGSETHKLVRVFYGTNRQASTLHDVNNPYGSELSQTLDVGVIEINVPTKILDDPTGIARPNELVFSLRGDGSGDDLIIESIRSFSRNSFVSTLQKEIRESNRKELILFVHGYNQTFRQALERAATLKIGLDNVGNGAVAMYSWPSGGSLRAYSEDRALISNDFVLDGMVEYINIMLRQSGAERVHLIAHSMGNEYLLAALNRMKDRGQLTGKTFNEVIFASPDVARGDFVAKTSRIASHADRLTLYASRSDQALRASKYLNAAKLFVGGGAGGSFLKLLTAQKRAGDGAPPLADVHFQTIDTTSPDVVVDLGHEDFVGPAINDLRAIIWYREKPDERCILDRRKQGSRVYWALDLRRGCDDEGYELAMFYLRRKPSESTADVKKLIRADRDAASASDRSKYDAALNLIDALRN